MVAALGLLDWLNLAAWRCKIRFENARFASSAWRSTTDFEEYWFAARSHGYTGNP
jgi:hypothetical protein